MATASSPVEMPSGIVTFLFTDIEGSTRRWESDPQAMRSALAAHDSVLGSVIHAHGGRLFKHMGDGVIAAFASASSAVEAAIEAQLSLDLPVRMGLGTGEVQVESGDYFGPTMNRAARVMSAGHGGQILVAETTEEVIDGFDLLDMGSRQLRDLAEPIRIYQVRAAGLQTSFPPLKTIDAVPGNLELQATSFIGRETELSELDKLVRENRIVTLVGVGGVGKTRLATQVAAGLTPNFPDGVWMVELASVEDPAAVPDMVATSLGVTPQAGKTVTQSLTQALSGRRLLIVFDNCEHVLDAAAQLVQTILASTETVSIMATSREALRVGAERAWPVPSLDVGAGLESAAVSLFVERAREAAGDFSLDDPAELEAVTQICEQLDGIALGIELAAARMVSMTAREVRDRLGDRFRLLSARSRGDARHQTLLQAVQWSYDLLTPDEQSILDCCSVFADGFVLDAGSVVCEVSDEYAMLDLLESLVRKSLVTVEQIQGHSRYGMLETIRQFSQKQLSASDSVEAVRDRHSQFFASQALAYWDIWDGPQQLESINWVDAELANLRVAYRWSADQGSLDNAAEIAAQTAIMSWPLQRFEPSRWCEDLLPAAAEAGIAQLPRLYTAASLCLYGGRPQLGVQYAQTASELALDPNFDPFVDGWSGMLESLGHLFGGRIDRRIEVSRAMVARTGFARLMGLCGLTWALPAVGQADEAMAIANETVELAREYGSPFWVGWALGGYGRAYAAAEPVKALEALREGLQYASDYRLDFWQANLAQDAARLEATHGELSDALALFARSIDSFHRAGNVVFLAATLASLAVFFDRIGEAETAATIYGSSTKEASISLVPELADVMNRLKSEVGAEQFESWVAAGASLDISESVRHAHRQIAAVAPQPTHSEQSDPFASDGS